MRIRVRGPNGTTTIALDPTAKVRDLRSEISQTTGLSAFDLKHGYPPQPFNLDAIDDNVALSDTGTKLDGEQLIVAEREMASALQHPLNNPPTTSTAARLPTHNPPATPPTPPNPANEPPEVPLPSHGATILLRVMPDDNSCLFRALSTAVLGPALDSMHELRSLVASAIAANPTVYTAAILDKEPEAYCRWIQTEQSWGGAIELQILAQHFGIEVASVSVKDGRIDFYNPGKEKRCILVFSGIHYDTVAMSGSDPPHTRADLPPEMDVKVFGREDEEVLQAALELGRLLKGRHYYTDTAKFALVCGQCGWKGRGEAEAVQHAKETGHRDLREE